MILTCPACATSYFVSDAAIGTNGRRVRCKSCGHDWRAVVEDEPLDLAQMASASLTPLESAPPAVEEETAPTPLPQAFRAREQERRRARKAVQQGLSWAILAIVLISVLTTAYLMRDSIVARVPGLASAYKAVGIQTNAVGLEFEAVNARYAAHDTSRVVISGAIRNIRDHEIVAPAVRISMRDNTGREIASHVLRIDAAPVLPGKVQGFAAILPNSEGRFSSAATTFVIEDRTADKSSKAATAASSKVAAGPAQPASNAETEAAKQDGLRRMGTLPVEDAPLDSKGQSDVSAGNG